MKRVLLSVIIASCCNLCFAKTDTIVNVNDINYNFSRWIEDFEDIEESYYSQEEIFNPKVIYNSAIGTSSIYYMCGIKGSSYDTEATMTVQKLEFYKQNYPHPIKTINNQDPWLPWRDKYKNSYNFLEVELSKNSKLLFFRTQGYGDGTMGLLTIILVSESSIDIVFNQRFDVESFTKHSESSLEIILGDEWGSTNEGKSMSRTLHKIEVANGILKFISNIGLKNSPL
ncbi:MAG: hypothetical protein E7071_01265 [Bacteroidales bacterium]|nr:hypothetical protein [Bacteroidales bacterium]